MSYRVQTQAFTGPFDLLLSLVSRQKVDIQTISIAEVTDQYLAEMDRMQQMDLDVASDFVLVASTLLDIKAAALVNEGEDLKAAAFADEDDDLLGLSPEEARDVLIARLIAYKQYRNAAATLGARLEAEARMHVRSAGPDPEFLNLMPDFLEGITLRSLAVICADLLGRSQELLIQAEHVAPPRLPVRYAVASVQRLVRAKGHASFSTLVGDVRTPETIVVTFLAILELYKAGEIRIEQEENFSEIEVTYIGTSLHDNELPDPTQISSVDEEDA